MCSSNRHASAGALLLVIAMVFTAACNAPPAPPPPTTSSTPALPARLFPNWPSEASEFRFHWSAEPGVDLKDGPAVALRAYVESYRLARFAGGDASAVDPGFMRATRENTGPVTKDGSRVQLRYVRPRTRIDLEAEGWTYIQRQVYGYQPTYILNLQSEGEFDKIKPPEG
jgi:hypothetical protein